MERMRGMDASFFYMETPDSHMHVVGTLILDPSTMPGGYAFQKIRDAFAERLHLLPPFRRRPVFVPFGLGHPVMVEDANFDIDQHMRRIGAPRPGSMYELAEIVGDIASRPLDRSKALWELTVVEGLQEGLIAIVTKMHHAVIDGTSGADLMVHLFDLEPVPREIEPPAEPWHGEQAPSDLKLVAGALVERLGQPRAMIKAVTKTGRAVTDVVSQLRQGTDAALPLTAPKTRFNGALTPHRSVSFGRTSLEDFKVIKKAFDVKVNDVVLAACTMALRSWLIDHDDLPDKPLIASVPVSVRSEDQKGEMGNRVSAMFAALPVMLEDPVEQLLYIHQRMKSAKELHNAIGADMLQDWAEFFGPSIFTRAMRLYSGMRLADRHRPIHNLVISNVPGPPIPLYTAGARVVSTYPMGPVLFGAGLNLTVLSNMGNVDFGAIACKELVPDIWDLPAGFADAVAQLRKEADKRLAPVRKPAKAVRKPAKAAAKRPAKAAAERSAKRPAKRTS